MALARAAPPSVQSGHIRLQTYPDGGATMSSWEWSVALGIVIVLLLVIAGLLYDTVKALNRIESELERIRRATQH